MQLSERMKVKRLLDLIVAVTALVLLAPLMAALTVIVRVDSPGPALFRQRRVGRRGVPFTVLKFRSMYNGSSQSLHHQASLDWFNERRQSNRYKSESDPRVTRLGKYLRRTSMDELPQLLNVVKGDMSLVGPRPLIEYERTRCEGIDFEREQVRPGLTGLWQVSGRDRLSARQMLALDVRYVREWSLWLDIKILARTIPAVLGELRHTGSRTESTATVTPTNPIET
jgi:lipopolysaccharide/colanic/teichoic acid biosynthesis glycosyltransferase